MADIATESLSAIRTDDPANAAQLQSAVAEAFSTQTTVRVVGGGSWRDAGHPVQSMRDLCVSGLRGVIEYVPGDLVITVGAGTTLAEIADVTAAHDQWLALDPAVSAAGLTRATIGATIATASHGPLAVGYGRVRDLVLGLSCVSGDGTMVHAGGRVVKNVAGFDLVRLLTGSWGTLGVIAEVSLRLHARPRIDTTFAIAIDWPADIDAQTATLDQLTSRLNDRAMLPTISALAALSVFTHDMPTYLSSHAAMMPTSCVMLARVMGNQTRVDAVRTTLGTLGDITEVSSDVWRTVRTSDYEEVAWRMTDAPMRSAETWRLAHQWLAERGMAHARVVLEPVRGALRLTALAPSAPRLDAADTWVLPARAIAERLPSSAWPLQPNATDDVISQRIRRAFDPAELLNRGVLGSPATRRTDSAMAVSA